MNHTDYCQRLYDACEGLVLYRNREKDSEFYPHVEVLEYLVNRIEQAMEGKEP